MKYTVVLLIALLCCSICLGGIVKIHINGITGGDVVIDSNNITKVGNTLVFADVFSASDANATFQIKLTSSTDVNVRNLDANNIDANAGNYIELTVNGNAVALANDVNSKVILTNFVKTADVNLAGVNDLSVSVIAGEKYIITGSLSVIRDLAGDCNVGLGGTFTSTVAHPVEWEKSISDSNSAAVHYTLSYIADVNGTGDLWPSFGQVSATGASTIIDGWIRRERIR
jgi:hypothetical protein